MNGSFIRNLKNLEDTEVTMKWLKKYSKNNKIVSAVLRQENDRHGYLDVYFTTIMFSTQFETLEEAKAFCEGYKAFSGLSIPIKIFNHTMGVMHCVNYKEKEVQSNDEN